MSGFSRSSQFKKDVKRMNRRGKDLASPRRALDLLVAGKPLPPECREHPLRGEFAIEGVRKLEMSIGKARP